MINVNELTVGQLKEISRLEAKRDKFPICENSGIVGSSAHGQTA